MADLRGGWDVSTGAGITALGLAAARSVETSRSDRLIEDPFARSLFDAANSGLPMLAEWPDPGSPVSDAQALHLHGSRYIGLRTRFYDDTLIAAARTDALQAVLLGAGLDTRAFRLEVPSAFRVFEIDQSGVLDFKDAALDAVAASPRCNRVIIGLDLREDWPSHLQARGFDRNRPTVWIAEGLLPYLPPQAQLGLLDRIDQLSAPSSRLAFDRIDGDPTAGGRLNDLSSRSGIEMDGLLAGGQAEDLSGFLAARRWKVKEEPASALARRYGRDLSDPFAGVGGSGGSEPPWLDTIFLSAALG